MALPKRRKSKSRRGMRRSHQALRARPIDVCPNCQEVKMPHRVCPECGYYNGRQVVEIKSEK